MKLRGEPKFLNLNAFSVIEFQDKFGAFCQRRRLRCGLKEIVRNYGSVGEKSLPFSGDKKGEEICMDKRILNEGGRKERREKERSLQHSFKSLLEVGQASLLV